MIMSKRSWHRDIFIGLGIADTIALLRELDSARKDEETGFWTAMLPHYDGDEYTTPFFFKSNEVEEVYLCIPDSYQYADDVDLEAIQAIADEVMARDQ
jgi:hypothetical protein